MLGLAALAVLVASNAGLIVAREAFGVEPPVLYQPARLATELALLAATVTRPAWRPVAPFIALLIALLVGQVVEAYVRDSFGSATTADTAAALLDDAFRKLIPTAFVLVALLLGGSGWHRYLRVGQVREGVRLGHVLLPWPVVAAIAAALLALPLAAQLAATLRAADAPGGASVVDALPLAVVFAIVNSLGEEVRFRAAPLARLVPALGPAPALVLTAVWFGIGHWYGHPSGASGVALAALAGGFLGWAMIRSRGLAVPVAIHFVEDVVIFVLVARAA